MLCVVTISFKGFTRKTIVTFIFIQHIKQHIALGSTIYQFIIKFILITVLILEVLQKKNKKWIITPPFLICNNQKQLNKDNSNIPLLKSHISIERGQIQVKNFNRGKHFNYKSRKQRKNRNLSAIWQRLPIPDLVKHILRSNGVLNRVLRLDKPLAYRAM